MQKEMLCEKTFCDVCNKQQDYCGKCLICKKDFCYDCQKSYTKLYYAGVHFSGSGDGIYCFECERKIRGTGNPLFLAYKKIESLRNEYEGFWSGFKKRTDDAERNIKLLLAKETE